MLLFHGYDVLFVFGGVFVLFVVGAFGASFLADWIYRKNTNEPEKDFYPEAKDESLD
jgi:hypothetical protein